MGARQRYKDTELLELPDCGGLLESGRCKWLHVPECLGTGCSYYHQRSNLGKTQARLCSLDEKAQEEISKKYYNGFRPWAEVGAKSWR